MIDQLNLLGEVANRWDQEFDEWWHAYPVKRDKCVALRKFRARRRQGVSLARLTAARDAYLAQATPGYVKYPATFLGVWDEWDVPPAVSETPSTALLRSPEVSFCRECGRLVVDCLCGQEIHAWGRG